MTHFRQGEFQVCRHGERKQDGKKGYWDKIGLIWALFGGLLFNPTSLSHRKTSVKLASLF